MMRLCGTGWEELSPEERDLVGTCFTDPLIRDMVRSDMMDVLIQ